MHHLTQHMLLRVCFTLLIYDIFNITHARPCTFVHGVGQMSSSPPGAFDNRHSSAVRGILYAPSNTWQPSFTYIRSLLVNMNANQSSNMYLKEIRNTIATTPLACTWRVCKVQEAEYEKGKKPRSCRGQPNQQS